VRVPSISACQAMMLRAALSKQTRRAASRRTASARFANR
jgi:hypothetical protein